jgi:hypothetical protein
MAMTQLSLFDRFADLMASIKREQIDTDITLGGRLELDREGDLLATYAPFDYVNVSARIVIVGITPGKQQATNALLAAGNALRMGKSPVEAAALAKSFASFSGPMRSNLVSMLDHFGLAEMLGVTSTAELFQTACSFAHFTSALRYPILFKSENYSGSPSLVRSPLLRRHLLEFTGQELSRIPGSLIVPLGPKVTEAMLFLAKEGLIKQEQILDGLQHPSGANNERIAYLLGRKPLEKLSAKTNPAKIDADRVSLLQKLASWKMTAQHTAAT